MHRRKKLATLKDVAEAAGYSVTTISRYLNRSIRLPEPTARRIDVAIESLDYRPNPHARSLSLGRSEAIGFVIPDIANPFFARLAAAVERAAAERRFGVLLYATLNRIERELEYLGRLSRNHVDGLIFITNHADDGRLARAINAASAIVVIDEDVAGTEAPKVFADNERGGYLAACHLIEAGHRRLAYVGAGDDVLTGRERLAGFLRAVDEAGPPAAAGPLLFGDYTAAHGRAAAEALLALDAPPTAVFAASDEIVIGLLAVFRQRGIRVGRDISVVAFDDVGPLDLFDPPVTAVRQAVDAMGHLAVQQVLALIEGGDAPAGPERQPVELVVRASVGPPLHS